jgi:hypothetical protein
MVFGRCKKRAESMPDCYSTETNAATIRSCASAISPSGQASAAPEPPDRPGLGKVYTGWQPQTFWPELLMYCPQV